MIPSPILFQSVATDGKLDEGAGRRCWRNPPEDSRDGNANAFVGGFRYGRKPDLWT